jgi:S-adenosylmethionine/arginine decarboxylase-like enzyme
MYTYIYNMGMGMGIHIATYICTAIYNMGEWGYGGMGIAGIYTYIHIHIYMHTWIYT